MFSEVKFFGGTQHKVNTRNISNFLWFELCIATGNNHKAFGCLPLNPSHQHAAFLIGIVGYGTGIDHIHICMVCKRPFFKTFLFHHTAKGTRFAEV